MPELSYQKLLTKGQIALGVISSILVFIFMSVMLVPYTFSPNPAIAQLQACFAAIPIATTFWFSINMFMIVLVDQKKQQSEKN
ncbi:hypothetical protein [Coraliomargarita akajimensis]|uniref:SSS family solute/sodium (Na+) symporter n=1 Tax=Coraliomargarita akajimensis (strain DSM 45221 / IAM 15411 / JCM 23193 / KCTC 12865 / 04OKA010-24) TaxID=583355 RepID=D5EP27_CORAD|nr:hypothetical protein [Coraliomargarita akajimensis]ADE55537.1 SSS family solute/sodium (Na+) symporter [Coraliomargarita akajimensis DSM 45221]